MWFTPAPADLSDSESPSLNKNCRHYSPFQRKACLKPGVGNRPVVTYAYLSQVDRVA